MILIICESNRIAKTVALAMGAGIETISGIYASTSLTVAAVPARFIRQTPLCEMSEGTYPFIPEKFRMAVTDKELERHLKPLFREAAEVVFASDGGADAQARFFNICRHFRVGCPTSRMWLTRLSYGAIRGAFHFREFGRHLYRLAQTGLVSKGMDLLFEYNFNQALLHIGLPDYGLTRLEVMALEDIGNCNIPVDNSDSRSCTIRVNVNSRDSYESQCLFKDEKQAEDVLSSLKAGDEIPANMTVEETTAYNIRFHTLNTLQLDAYNNLGFLPAKTAKVAQMLYEKGLVSSPLTSNSHLPEQLRGHIETVFGVSDGYPWGDNGATINDHAIITLRAAENGMSTAEVQLYRLIFNRMKAVVEQQPTRKFAVKEFTVGDARFSQEWELTGEAYEVTEPGTFNTMVKIEDAAVYPCNTVSSIKADLSDVMWSMEEHDRHIVGQMQTNLPFTKSLSDHGSVISSLIRKGLVCIEGNNLYLSPEGSDIYDELAGREFSETLLTWQLEANALYDGNQTGRSVIEGFSNSMMRMVEMIDPESEA
ncbi:MAG: DNA topoisomerase [Muribaculum sp.]|nr:DNA topoisomerase [Muribaculum sp.]